MIRSKQTALCILANLDLNPRVRNGRKRAPSFKYTNSSKWTVSFWDMGISVGFWVRTRILAPLPPGLRVLDKLCKLARLQFLYLKYGKTASTLEVTAAVTWDKADGFQHSCPTPHETAQGPVTQHTPENGLSTITSLQQLCSEINSHPTCGKTTTLPDTGSSPSHRPFRQMMLPLTEKETEATWPLSAVQAGVYSAAQSRAGLMQNISSCYLPWD